MALFWQQLAPFIGKIFQLFLSCVHKVALYLLSKKIEQNKTDKKTQSHKSFTLSQSLTPSSCLLIFEFHVLKF